MNNNKESLKKTFTKIEHKKNYQRSREKKMIELMKDVFTRLKCITVVYVQSANNMKIMSFSFQIFGWILCIALISLPYLSWVNDSIYTLEAVDCFYCSFLQPNIFVFACVLAINVAWDKCIKETFTITKITIRNMYVCVLFFWAI